MGIGLVTQKSASGFPTALTGWLVQYSGYYWVFALTGVLHPLAFLVFRGLVRGELRIARLDGAH
jgi:hypothetical protein